MNYAAVCVLFFLVKCVCAGRSLKTLKKREKYCDILEDTPGFEPGAHCLWVVLDVPPSTVSYGPSSLSRSCGGVY